MYDITLQQLYEFWAEWAKGAYPDQRFGQAFMNVFNIESLVCPLGDVWDIRGKDDTKKLQAWLVNQITSQQ